MSLTCASRSTRSVFVMLAFALAWGGCSKSHDLMARVNEPADAGLAANNGAGGSATGSGGDSTNGIASGQPGAAGSGTSGSGNAGSGGASSPGGAGGTGNVGGQPVPGAGGMTGGMTSSGNVTACSPCADAMSMFGTAPACCTADKKCGVDVSGLTGAQGGGQGGGRGGGRGGGQTAGAPKCLQQNAPGTLDTNCPAYDYMGVFMIPGCCKANKTCGVMIRMLAPVGCVEPTDLFGGRPAPAVPCG